MVNKMKTNERIEKYFATNLVETLSLDDYIVTDVGSAVESAVKKNSVKEKNELEMQKSDDFASEYLLSIQKFFLQNESLMKTYPMIDLSFFDMNKKNKLYLPKTNTELATVSMPIFMLYSLDLDKPKIFLKRYLEGSHFDTDTSGFELTIDGLSLMKDHGSMLEQWANSIKRANAVVCQGRNCYKNAPLWGVKSESYQIKSPVLKSIIPEDVLSEIAEAKKVFGNQIYIVPYVNEWFVQEFETSIISKRFPAIMTQNLKEDPLVIAGSAEQIKNGYGFLIASFDPVPMEEYVIKSYSGGKPMQN